MKLLFISDYFSPAIMQAICRTLLHSLWQGLLAASLAGIIILSTKRSKAAIRYNLLSFVFICSIAGSLITFLKQPGILPAANTEQVVHFIPAINSTQATKAGSNHWLPAIEKEKFYRPVVYYADKYAGLITGMWMLFFLVHILRMLAGLHYIHRIRNYQVAELTDEWKERLLEMSNRLGIRKALSLMESGLVKVPVVIGVLKPVILIPAGMISNLSVEQVETVLLHELAHVRRKDFAINLLQRVAEAFFFFNPFIAWISARIREEREACCDDIVIQHAADKRSYLEALISFRQAGAQAYGHAMALGKNNNLLHRVKRMITQENKKLNAMEKLTLILVLTAFGALSFMPAGKVAAKKKADTNRQVISIPSNENSIAPTTKSVNLYASEKQPKDTVPEKKPLKFNNISTSADDDGSVKKENVTATTTDGKTYSYRLENKKMIELSVNGQKIKEEDFNRYDGVIDQVEACRNKNKEESLEDQKKILRELQEKQDFISSNQIDLEKEISENQLKQQQLLKEIQNKNIGLEKEDAHNLELNRKLAKLKSQNNILTDKQNFLADELQKLQLNNDDHTALAQLKKGNSSMNYESLAQQDRELQELAELRRDNKELLHKDQFELQNKLQLLSEQDEKFNVSNAELAQIIYELSKAGVLKDEKNFSFTLNDDELIVDGKRQATDLYESLRKKHIRNKKDHFTYKVKENSRSTDIYVE